MKFRWTTTMRSTLFALTVLAGLAPAQATPMKAADRIAFITSGMKTCVAESNGMSGFCECYMQALARKVNQEELDEIERNGLLSATREVQEKTFIAMLKDRAAASADECLNPRPWWKVW